MTRNSYIINLAKSENDESLGQPLYDSKKPFAPSSDIEMDLKEGLRLLGNRFPYLRKGGNGGSSESSDKRISYGLGLTDLTNTKVSLKKHFEELLLSYAGDQINSNDWEIPIAIIHFTTGSVNPRLPIDVYYLRIVPANGKLVWRFSGSRGNQINMPIIWKKKISDKYNYLKLGDLRVSGSLRYGVDLKTKSTKIICLQNWAGFNPTCVIELQGIPTAISHKNANEMAATLPISYRTGDFDASKSSPELLNLDQSRKKKLLINWNYNSGFEIYKLIDSGKSGYVDVAAIVSDQPLIQPDINYNSYILRVELQSSKNKPIFKIIPIRNQVITKESFTLQNNKDSANRGWYPQVPKGRSDIRVIYGISPAENGSMPLAFGISGISARKVSVHQENGSTIPQEYPEVWVSGQVLIKQP